MDALLEALQSPSNELRGAAEVELQRCRSQPDTLCVSLARVLTSAASRSDLREVAAVLLRRLACGGEAPLWPALQGPTRDALKQELLRCFTAEAAVPGAALAKKVGDLLSELAGVDSAWPELLPCLFGCVTSGSDSVKEHALLVFERLVDHAAVVDALSPHVPALVGALVACMQLSSPLRLRAASLGASAALAEAMGGCGPYQRSALQSLLPAMLATLEAALNGGDEEAAQGALSRFCSLAESAPRFVWPRAPSLLAAALAVAESSQLDDDTRQLGVECALTLAKARRGRTLFAADAARRLFASALRLLDDIDDDPAWGVAADESSFDAGQGDGFAFGMEALDRMSTALGGTLILPCLTSQLPPALSSPSWVSRHGALCCVAQVVEGIAKAPQLASDPASLARPVLAAVADPHPRVAWAAINAAAQMCTDLGPGLQAAAGGDIAAALASSLAPHIHPRVAAHAAAAVLNLVDGCEVTSLSTQSVDGLVAALLSRLVAHAARPASSPPPPPAEARVAEGAASAVASLADWAGASFARYAPAVVPVLLDILEAECVSRAAAQAAQSAQAAQPPPASRLLLCKALEGVTLVALAVGAASLGSAACDRLLRAMGAVESLHAARPPAGDDQSPAYLRKAWCCLSKAVGAPFEPYLPRVLPPLLAAAGAKPDLVVSVIGEDGGDGGGDDGGDDDDDGEMTSVRLGNKLVSIRTSALEDKAECLHFLCLYFECHTGGMLPYAQPAAALAFPLLRFYLSEDLRTAAAELLPGLAGCCAAAASRGEMSPQQLAAFVDSLWTPLIAALNEEPDAVVAAAMVTALGGLASAAGRDAVAGASQRSSAASAVASQLVTGAKELAALAAARGEADDTQAAGGGAGAGAAEEATEEEEEDAPEVARIDEAADALGRMLATWGAPFLAHFGPVSAAVLPLFSSPLPAVRVSAAGVFADVVTHCGPSGGPFLPPCLPHLLAGCRSPSAALRQACAFGLGMAATCDSFAPASHDAAAALVDAASAPCGERDTDAKHARDNALSAIARALEARPSLHAPAAVDALVNGLPLESDLEEAVAAHAGVARMVAARDPRFAAHAQRLRAAFAACAARPGLVDADTAATMAALLATSP